MVIRLLRFMKSRRKETVEGSRMFLSLICPASQAFAMNTARPGS